MKKSKRLTKMFHTLAVKDSEPLSLYTGQLYDEYESSGVRYLQITGLFELVQVGPESVTIQLKGIEP